MKSKKSTDELERSYKRLDQTAKKIVETRGYTSEVAKIKILAELIREQFNNENTRSSIS